MAFEKQIPAVEPRQLTSDGGTLGQIQIADTRGYKVGAKAVIVAVSQPDLNVQIKRVMSETLMLVGPIGSPYSKAEWTNVAAYTVAAGAYIYAQAQEKAKVPANDRDDATYDQEPTVAWRNVLVDQLGRYYETANPLPVRLTDGSVPWVYFDVAYPTTTREIYSFYTGAARPGGTLARTVQVEYTDATKNFVASGDRS